jgi:hypothetical protein
LLLLARSKKEVDEKYQLYLVLIPWVICTFCKYSDRMQTSNEEKHTQKNHYTDENEIFLIYKEIQMGAGAKLRVKNLLEGPPS